MSKKIIATLLVILIGLPLLFFFGSAVILFLAPGTEIFGVRYVSAALNVTVKDGVQTLSSFSGDAIYIETHGVPITIQFSDYYASSVSFTQNFVGYTRSKYERPYLEVDTSSGDLYIKAHELVKFVHAREDNGNYEMVITLSRAYVQNKDITIVSKDSPVVVSGVAQFSSFSMESRGGLTVENKLTAPKFKLHTMQSITVDEKIVTNSVDLKSTGSFINIEKALSGDIVAETKNGDIKFISCNNLTAKSGSGSIKCLGSGLAEVKGTTNIETRGGSVQLGRISTLGSNYMCYIKTTSGSIDINQMVSGEISSERGRVYVNSATNLVINDKVGNVTVGTVTDGIVVNGRNGKVSLGENGIVGNPTVKTTSGIISVLNATGKVRLESTNNKITFKNSSSSDISLKAGRSLNATGLKGVVSAYANGDVNLSFAEISGYVEISVGSKSDDVIVDATCARVGSIDYYLRSSKGKKAKVYAGDELIEENTTIDTGTNVDKKKISVKSSYARIILKLSA